MTRAITPNDLAEAFRRLVAGLAWLDDQPDGADRARGIRTRLHDHLGQLADGLAGKARKCDQHPGHLAHNCGPCRSERIGIDPQAPYSHLPATAPDVAEVEARRLGESESPAA